MTSGDKETAHLLHLHWVLQSALPEESHAAQTEKDEHE